MPSCDYFSYERKELIRFIPDTIEKTLDVGCGSGVFSRNLKKISGNVETWGIEIVEQYAKIAEQYLDHVLTGPIDRFYDKLPDAYYDCIFFNDVLEHLVEPEECLKRLKTKLKAGKTVIASIPNIRHINILLDLLFKKDWRYTESGIMDRTHLRFFTQKSIIRMFDTCGYKIERIEGINSVGRYCLTSIINTLLFNALEDVKYKQFVVVATPK
ncbi:MAG: class I SAM-dependent methyltransferase [Prevotella sp.]|jgi:2-polyprenyl-3-methyl-5-hydroxy-6-metoxy-1,4-benzoquinol methylase|nr:class I SAM-dependent methyltransferase [Prevotella sp.]